MRKCPSTGEFPLWIEYSWLLEHCCAALASGQERVTLEVGRFEGIKRINSTCFVQGSGEV